MVPARPDGRAGRARLAVETLPLVQQKVVVQVPLVLQPWQEPRQAVW
jgi:hypothetical protein